MPKISSKQNSVKIALSDTGVASVDKALGILRLFHSDAPELSLMQIAERTGLYKSTALRMLASLESALLVIKKMDGKYALGPTIASLYAAYQHQQSLEAIVMPILNKLMRITHESAAFHVRQGDKRLCLYRVDSNQALRDHIKVGDLLPIDKGAGGKVLRAFEGSKDKASAQIRKDMVLAITGDRVKEISGISAPVFNAEGLVGVITLTMPTYRFNPKMAATIKSNAKALTELLGGQFQAQV
ncbi:IclR family transcriptional regulator [Polynucleobacter tropicus]|uniref:IclR family transcriptional regulator n=1 Tax=Polynucleobacter tropicus TaxID=1743174 RepID=A0A6M9Q782_9BURK|nr:IclR family transcriptional regulator [Polynucleobacter tropicus]QKM64973.1 IclR family transcriptional regulator [Polynucleobacter tropicus]